MSAPETTTVPEIRCDEDGSLDEVVATGCDFHLEQMGGNMWWMSVSSGGSTIHVTLSTKNEEIKATCQERITLHRPPIT